MTSARPQSRKRPSGEPIADVLSRVERELHAAQRSLHRLQSAIGPLVLAHSGGNGAKIQELQNLDHVTQTLASLADFLAALAAMAPRRWSLESHAASEVLKLADLAARLRASPEDWPTIPNSGNGECEFFDF